MGTTSPPPPRRLYQAAPQPRRRAPERTRPPPAESRAHAVRAPHERQAAHSYAGRRRHAAPARMSSTSSAGAEDGLGPATRADPGEISGVRSAGEAPLSASPPRLREGRRQVRRRGWLEEGAGPPTAFEEGWNESGGTLYGRGPLAAPRRVDEGSGRPRLQRARGGGEVREYPPSPTNALVAANRLPRRSSPTRPDQAPSPSSRGRSEPPAPQRRRRGRSSHSPAFRAGSKLLAPRPRRRGGAARLTAAGMEPARRGLARARPDPELGWVIAEL
jgi:hypothetical protein